MDLGSQIALGALILQTIVLLGAIATSYVKTRERLITAEGSIETLTVQYEHIDKNTQELKEKHAFLSNKVDGIGRHVATIEGRLQNG